MAQEPTLVQITSGSGDDVHPAFVTSAYPFGNGAEEWLAFTRLDLEIDATSICVATVAADSIHWPESVYYVISDSMAYNDFPSIARVRNMISDVVEDVRGMLVWQRKVVDNDVYYSYYTGNSWSAPQALATDPRDDQHPDVVPSDTSFGVVWEQEGRILYSEFIGGRWSVPARVSPAADSANHFPRMLYLFPGYGVTAPMVIWEMEKPADSTRAIMYSVRWDSGWSAPDTIAWSGDNRSARFTRGSTTYNLIVTWESNRGGKWDIYKSAGETIGDSLYWGTRSELNVLNSGADNHDFCSIIVPIICNYCASVSDILYTSATWRVVSGTSQSIAVSRYNSVSYLTGAPGTENIDPAISSGIWYPDGIRIWSVWRNTGIGNPSKLYGTYVDVIEEGVDDRQGVPNAFSLYPNYPNPFNPSTTFQFVLPHSCIATLKVFNILGEEIATVLSERLPTGFHSVEWVPTGLASGVYFYRLEAGPFTETKKMVLLR